MVSYTPLHLLPSITCKGDCGASSNWSHGPSETRPTWALRVIGTQGCVYLGQGSLGLLEWMCDPEVCSGQLEMLVQDSKGDMFVGKSFLLGSGKL